MWYACSIALNSWFEHSPISGSKELARGIRLEPIPSWVKEDDALKPLARAERKRIRKAELAFATEYEAQALGSPDPEWTGNIPRAIQSAVDEKFVLAAVALWLVKPCRLSCGPVLHFGRKGDPGSLRTAGSLNPVLIREDENGNVPTADDLDQTGRCLEAILSLRRDTATWIAVRWLVRALTESTWEARYLWQWIVLEALFGPEGPSETTYRLAQRIALFLGETREDKRRLFDEAKQAYSWRSKIVHGRRLSKLIPEKSEKLSVVAEDLIRAAFVKIVNAPELLRQFDSTNRDEFLDGLSFG
jgi:hypothetical protein